MWFWIVIDFISLLMIFEDSFSCHNLWIANATWCIKCFTPEVIVSCDSILIINSIHTHISNVYICRFVTKFHPFFCFWQIKLLFIDAHAFIYTTDFIDNISRIENELDYRPNCLFLSVFAFPVFEMRIANNRDLHKNAQLYGHLFGWWWFFLRGHSYEHQTCLLWWQKIITQENDTYQKKDTHIFCVLIDCVDMSKASVPDEGHYRHCSKLNMLKDFICRLNVTKFIWNAAKRDESLSSILFLSWHCHIYLAFFDYFEDMCLFVCVCVVFIAFVVALIFSWATPSKLDQLNKFSFVVRHKYTLSVYTRLKPNFSKDESWL